MVIVGLFLKPVVWYMAFKSSVIEDLKTMLLWAAGITLFLTLIDKFSVAENLGNSAILLTFVLYALMSFILLPLGWKIKNAKIRVALNIFGTLGAFAGVNFTMDFLRGILPFMQL
ncbi:MAG: hypothetical protein PHN84_14005 [Desulfuromonadaceae bacterium]|nr:hypothetical protein [Desulfuromonadaceae bacterium]MDD2855000.1 hypothetical protein [Desulfuromonadaceae bacterium]